MTRTARMPKKKHLEATSWEEMRLKGSCLQTRGSRFLPCKSFYDCLLFHR